MSLHIARIATSNMFRPSNPLLKPLPREPIMNRAKRGLYHGKHIMFGNNVAHSERKTRRTFFPNVQKHKYYSDVLEEKLSFRLTTHAMRCIDKVGGIDNYLLKTPKCYLGGDKSIGMRLKQKLNDVIAEKKYQEELNALIEQQALKLQAAKSPQ